MAEIYPGKTFQFYHAEQLLTNTTEPSENIC